MVDRTIRPIVPLRHIDSAEHRRLLAERANASLPKDGTEAMAAPLRVAPFEAADLPDATLWEGSIIFVSDAPAGQKFKGSNGTAWVNLG